MSFESWVVGLKKMSKPGIFKGILDFSLSYYFNSFLGVKQGLRLNFIIFRIWNFHAKKKGIRANS